MPVGVASEAAPMTGLVQHDLTAAAAPWPAVNPADFALVGDPRPAWPARRGRCSATRIAEDASAPNRRQPADLFVWLSAVSAPGVFGVKLGVVDYPQGVAAVVGDCDRERMAGCPDVAEAGRSFPVDQGEPVELACHHAPFASSFVEI